MKTRNRIAQKALPKCTNAWFREVGFRVTVFHTSRQKIQSCVLARSFDLSWLF